MSSTLGTCAGVGLVRTRHTLTVMDVPRGMPRAIVRPSEADRVITVDRVAASPALAGFVDYYWYVGWRTPEEHRQQVVPQPRVHVAMEPFDGAPRLLVHGISREP